MIFYRKCLNLMLRSSMEKISMSVKNVKPIWLALMNLYQKHFEEEQALLTCLTKSRYHLIN